MNKKHTDFIIILLLIFIILLHIKKLLCNYKNLEKNSINDKNDSFETSSNNNNNEMIEHNMIENNTIDNIPTSNKYEMLFFWASWCGHCQDKKPIWEKITKDLKIENCEIKNIDCSKQDTTKCYILKNNKKEHLIGVPTIVLRNKNKNHDIEFLEDLNLNNLKNFLSNNNLN